MKKLFRQAPPKELVERILKSCGLTAGFEELRWFRHEELLLSSQEDWLPELEPYYLPCKASRFLGSGLMTTERLITILRHCIAPHGYELHHQERTLTDKKKHTMYQLYPVRPFLSSGLASLEVTFE